MASKKLRDAINRRFAERQPATRYQPGLLGDDNGTVQVAGKPGYVYVRINDMLTYAYNDTVPNRANMPVYVSYSVQEPDRLIVTGTRTMEADDIPTRKGNAAPHHFDHEWMANGGGDDVVYVDERQFLPFRVWPAAGLSIYIYRGITYSGTQDYLFEPTGSYDLSPLVPATSGSGRWVVVSMSSSGSLCFTPGDVMFTNDLSVSNIPAAPTGHAQLAAVRVYHGQNQIAEARTSRDIVDLRFSTLGRGGGGGSAYTGVAPIDVTADQISHQGSGVTPGTYPMLTVDIRGHATAGRALTAADLGTGTATSATWFRGDMTWNQMLHPVPVSEYINRTICYAVWMLDGALAAASGAGLTFTIPQDGYLGRVYVNVEGSGSSGNTVVDVHRNGTTVFGSSKPTIPYTSTSANALLSTSVSSGDKLTLDIDSAAVGAERLTVQVEIYETISSVVFSDGEIVVTMEEL